MDIDRHAVPAARDRTTPARRDARGAACRRRLRFAASPSSRERCRVHFPGAGLIRVEGNPAPVGRNVRLVLDAAGRVQEHARRATGFQRQRLDVTPRRLEYDELAVGRPVRRPRPSENRRAVSPLRSSGPSRTPSLVRCDSSCRPAFVRQATMQGRNGATDCWLAVTARRWRNRAERDLLEPPEDEIPACMATRRPVGESAIADRVRQNRRCPVAGRRERSSQLGRDCPIQSIGEVATSRRRGPNPRRPARQWGRGHETPHDGGCRSAQPAGPVPAGTRGSPARRSGRG